MANIGANELSLCAKGVQLCDQLGARVAVMAGDDDSVAFLGEGQGRGSADPGECARNQDNGDLALLASFGLK